MRKYEESKTNRIMMATVPHVTSVSGLRKFQADGFLLDRAYIFMHLVETIPLVGYWDYCVFNRKSCYWLLTPGDLFL